jgi:hypothetical protein
MASNTHPTPTRELLAAACCAALALLLGACASAPTTGPGRPRGGPEAPYPVLLVESDERRERALAGWAAVLGAGAAAGPTPELRPVTATPVRMPSALAAPPRMPRVIIDEEAEQSEEETRESLRRFITSAAALVGSELRELSLVEIVDAPAGGGLKLARYQQRPFHYPLRNGFGQVEITFAPDLRVTDLTSTAIPEGERLRPLLRSVTRQFDAQKAGDLVAGRGVAYADAAGQTQTRPVAAADITPRALVIFPVRREGDAPALELHYAWELAVAGPGPPLLVYIDAVNGEQLAARAEEAAAGSQ